MKTSFTPKELRKDSKLYIQAFKDNDHMGNLIGGHPVSINEKECIYEYTVNPGHFNPNGFLHGGALYTAMDSSQGFFIHFVLDEKFDYAVTGTATIRYEKPVLSGVATIKTFIERQEGRKYFVRSLATQDSQLLATLDEVWIAIEPKVAL